ncbi:unnamed protein product [Cochlearia groenlandica]
MKHSLEIELISAEGLKINRKPVKRKTFCIVRIGSKSWISKPDQIGDNYPVWREKIEMEMALNENITFIIIEVLYKTTNGVDKNIGVAKIPVIDFMGGFAPPKGFLNFLSYRLRDEYGDKSGILNVSITVKPYGEDVRSSSSPSRTVGLGGYNRREVTGVPVWCAYQWSY